MHTGKGQVNELLLQGGLRYARISCPASLIPSTGQYLLASAGSDAILPVPVYYTESAPDGFIAAPAPDDWMPGMDVALRGPLGRGFEIPGSASKVCLAAIDDMPFRLCGLMLAALNRGAAVALVTDSAMGNLPDEVEVHPLGALGDILLWADYAAIDVSRERLPDLLESLREQNQLSAWREAEVLVHIPIPCGGVGECGVCAVRTKSGWRMACKDGPVFALGEL